MTERTIRSMAKELANIFYDDNRSPPFRKAYPTRRHYLRGQIVKANGDIEIDKPGWLYHVDLARKCLTQMLTMPDTVVHPNIKEKIYEAFLAEHEQRQRIKPMKVTQRTNNEPLH